VAMLFNGKKAKGSAKPMIGNLLLENSLSDWKKVSPFKGERLLWLFVLSQGNLKELQSLPKLRAPSFNKKLRKRWFL